jgi:FkbM family methyltransferase
MPIYLDTNLGIDRKLRVRISSSKPWLLFGAPRLFLSERSSLDLSLALFKHSDCFLDIGSNIGLFVFYLRYRDPSSKPIYFFEPDPALFSQLKQNISMNKVQHVNGFQIAISENTQRALFYRNKSDDSCGTLVKENCLEHLHEAIEIDQIPLADFVRKHQLKNICVKVDVEGAEELFFAGTKSCLDKLNYLIIEILGPAIGRGFPVKVIREGNFQAYYINDYVLEYSPSGEFNYVAPFYNWLFCRDNPRSLSNKLRKTPFRVIG